jgi:hypothetical protein
MVPEAEPEPLDAKASNGGGSSGDGAASDGKVVGGKLGKSSWSGSGGGAATKSAKGGLQFLAGLSKKKR